MPYTEYKLWDEHSVSQCLQGLPLPEQCCIPNPLFLFLRLPTSDHLETVGCDVCTAPLKPQTFHLHLLYDFLAKISQKGLVKA